MKMGLGILRLKCKEMPKKHLLVYVDGWTVQKAKVAKTTRNSNLQVDSRFELTHF